MENKFILLLSLLMFIPNLKAQDICGVTSNKDSKSYKKIINSFSNSKTYSEDFPTIRLSLNKVNRTNGTSQGTGSWSQYREMVGELSSHFNNEVCFTIIEENTINDDLYYFINDWFVSSNVFEPNYVNLINENSDSNNSIRIYFLDHSLNGGIATNPFWDISPTDDFTVTLTAGILINGEVISALNSEILAHEIGHCLGLVHTHESRETSSGDVLEHVIRSGPTANCNVEGDLLCDTPADFNLYFFESTSDFDIPACELISSIPGPGPIDPNYDPDLNNFMSYARPNCMTQFTPGQLARVNNFITQTDILDPIIIPENIEINGSSSNDEVFASDKNIVSSRNHSVSDVAYLARNEITLKPGFMYTPTGTNQFKAKIEDNGCFDFTIKNSGLLDKEIISRTNEINGIQENFEINLFPNPVSESSFFIKLGEETIDEFIEVRIFDLRGNIRQYINQKTSLEIEIPITNLETGLFIVQISVSDHTINRKIIVN